MAELVCSGCGGPVDPKTGYRVFADGGTTERWFDTEACLAADDRGKDLVSPGAGRINVDDQPAMVLVPAAANYTGPTVAPQAIAALMGGSFGTPPSGDTE